MTSPSSPNFTWHDGFLLGYGPMDDTHEEFVALVGAMKAAPDAQLSTRLDRFCVHAQQHFAAEDGWMRDTAFPARDCHIGEHAAVLDSVLAVQRLVASGDCSQVRRLVEHLEGWFPGHADYLDSALAHWMCKLRWGGKPVVIRRQVGTSGVAPIPD